MNYLQKKLTKLPLSSADDKRIICEDKINTLSHGHYSKLK